MSEFSKDDIDRLIQGGDPERFDIMIGKQANSDGADQPNGDEVTTSDRSNSVFDRRTFGLMAISSLLSFVPNHDGNQQNRVTKNPEDIALYREIAKRLKAIGLDLKETNQYL